MSSSVNGQSVVPPGFRFHPTEEELLTYYLAKKVATQPIDLDVIPDVDLNKLEPWDIQERCRIGTGLQNDWYLFSHKDKKYPTGKRTNRATTVGFWKATGRDKAIYPAAGSGHIGMRKTLVFYKGRAPYGHKTDWIMHEYRLDAATNPAFAAGDAGTYYSGASASSPIRGMAGEQSSMQEDGWVICRMFKKKNIVVQQQAGQCTGGGGAATKLRGDAAMAHSQSYCSSTVTTDSDHAKAAYMMQQQQQQHYSDSDDAPDHILPHYMHSRSSTSPCKQDTNPTNPSSSALDHLINSECHNGSSTQYEKLPPLEHSVSGGLLPPPIEYGGEWDALDGLAAYELNGLSDAVSANTMNGIPFLVDEHGANMLLPLCRNILTLE